MSEGTFQRQEMRFDATGLGLMTPTDQSHQGESFPILVNVRQIVQGTFKQRPGLNTFLTAPGVRTPWHSIRRLNDRFANDYTYVSGIGTGLSYGKAGVLAEIDTGYSGRPLSMLPYRPPQAYNEWMAVADANKMRKVKYDGTVRTLGIPSPVSPPTAGLGDSGPLTRVIQNGNSAVGWTVGALGEVPATNLRVNTAIGAGGYVYAGVDPGSAGSTGWYSVHLASLDNITIGSLLTAANGTTMLVEEIHPASPAGAGSTISRVIGDNGTTTNVTGWFWIVPSIALPQIKPHSMLKLGVATYVSVIDVLEGPDGQLAIRGYLGIGALNFGDSVDVVASVFGHLSNVPTSPYTATGVVWPALAASNTHNLIIGSGGSPLNLNLASFSSGGRAITEKDEVSAIIYVGDVGRVSELKIEVDVNDGTYRDYYTRSIAPHEFIPVTRNTVTAQDNRPTEARRRVNDQFNERERMPGRKGLGDWRDGTSGHSNSSGTTDMDTTSPTDTPGSAASRTSTGNAQWFKVRFKVSDWRRVGESKGKDLQNIISARAVVITNGVGPTDFGIDDWMIIGGYEPDVTDGAPYEYRYRYRDSSTGERSNWSPPSRAVVLPHRYPVTVYTSISTTTGVDKVDIQRRGGQVNEWRLIGTVANAGTFSDVYSDEHALGVGINPDALEGNVNAQPFTLARGPLVLTGCTVSGPHVYNPAATFNTSLAQGTPVIVNGVPSLVYKMHSASLMELYGHCGSTNVATAEIPQQFFTGQPLPVIFGMLDGWAFALGDTYNPGRLYFFNYGTLGSTRSNYYIDVSDNSEALLNGCVHNGRAYVWTSERMYAINFSGDENIFRSDPMVGGAGLYARWALTVGDAMYWLGKDGVYTSDGGAVINIIRRDLLPLFSNEGQDGVTTNTITAPHMPQNATVDQLAELRLSYAHNKYLYLDYKNSNGDRRTLVLDRSIGEQGQWGWYHDIYAQGVVFHYPDEGEGVRNIIALTAETPGRALTLGGAGKRDAGSSFNCQIRSLAVDGGDLRSEKMFGDGFLDINPGNGSITPTFYFDNFGTSIVGAALTGATRIQPPTIVDFDNGVGKYARNIAIDLSWSVTDDTVDPVLYGWGFSVMGRPERTIKRATDYSDLGHWGPKELKGLSIEIDTGGVDRDIVIEYTKEDGTVATIAKTVNTGQKDIEHMSWAPVVCYEARIRPTDTDRWRFYETVKWHYEPLTDMTAMVGDWVHFNRAVWVQGVEIDGDTNNAIISTPIQRDFSEVIRTISAQHNGRGTKAYSFDPPFIAYMVRTAPSGLFRRMKERWIWKPEAPIGTVWHTQEFELGDPYGFARDVEVEYAAGAVVTLKYYVDGTLVHTDATTLTSTGNTETFIKRQVDLPARKGRLAYIRLECSTGVRVRQNGTVISGKAFGGNSLTRTPVVGDTHGYGAEV